MKFRSALLNIFRNLHLNSRFFLSCGGLIALFALSFKLEFLMPITQVLAILLLVVTATDILILFNPNADIRVNRTVSKLLSLGDENRITLEIH